MSSKHPPSTRPRTIDGLVHWLSVEHPEWLQDALWLRYTQLKKKYQRGPKQLMHPPPTTRAIPPPASSRVLILPSIPPADCTDLLSTLPHDLRLEIFSFLFAPYVDKSEAGVPFAKYIPERLYWTHAYNQLALVNRTWRDQVEAFCSHQLLVLKQAVSVVDDYEVWEPWRGLRTYTSCARMELVVRLMDYCAFCGKMQMRIANAWPGLRCCHGCELKRRPR